MNAVRRRVHDPLIAEVILKCAYVVKRSFTTLAFRIVRSKISGDNQHPISHRGSAVFFCLVSRQTPLTLSAARANFDKDFNRLCDRKRAFIDIVEKSLAPKSLRSFVCNRKKRMKSCWWESPRWSPGSCKINLGNKWSCLRITHNGRAFVLLGK